MDREIKLWPHREGWSADCNELTNALEPNKAWQGGSATKWTHQKPMEIGDYFMLDICKPRIISRIRLDTEEPRRPTKYNLSIKANKYSNWEDIGEFSTLDVKLTKPKKITKIKWTITEPSAFKWPDNNKPVAWAIFDIWLTEVRLFGKWWHKVIEEKKND